MLWHIFSYEAVTCENWRLHILLWFFAKVKTLDGVNGMLVAAGNTSNDRTFLQDFL